MLNINKQPSYALVDISFTCDKVLNFARKISIAGIEESNKTVQYDFKYIYPTTKTTTEKQNCVTNGNLYNDNITQIVNKKLNKFAIILVNGKDKKDFLIHFVKCKSVIYDISTLIDENEFGTDQKSTCEE